MSIISFIEFENTAIRIYVDTLFLNNKSKRYYFHRCHVPRMWSRVCYKIPYDAEHRCNKFNLVTFIHVLLIWNAYNWKLDDKLILGNNELSWKRKRTRKVWRDWHDLKFYSEYFSTPQIFFVASHSQHFISIVTLLKIVRKVKKEKRKKWGRSIWNITMWSWFKARRTFKELRCWKFQDLKKVTRGTNETWQQRKNFVWLSKRFRYVVIEKSRSTL